MENLEAKIEKLILTIESNTKTYKETILAGEKKVSELEDKIKELTAIIEEGNNEISRMKELVNQYQRKIEEYDSALSKLSSHGENDLLHKASITQNSVSNEKYDNKVTSNHNVYDVEGFREFMRDENLMDSTANDYARRISLIIRNDKIDIEYLVAHIEEYLYMYTQGIKADDNRSAHNAFSSALYKFKKYINR